MKNNDKYSIQSLRDMKTLEELSKPSPKIIQIQIMQEDEIGQALIVGLGDDGVTYIQDGNFEWEVYIRSLESSENKQ